MLKRILVWLFKDAMTVWDAAWRDLFRRLDAVQDAISASKQPAKRACYVTLRGVMVLENGKSTAHGWTKRIDVAPGQSDVIDFYPHNLYKTERIETLGPCEIIGANVGNRTMTSPEFQHPSTFAFEWTAEVGNVVRVYVKGID